MSEQMVALLNQLTTDAIAWAPRLVVMFLLIVLGLMTAWIGERLLSAALVRLKFDALLGRTGVDRTLHLIGVRTPLEKIVPRIAFYLILFLFVRAAADALGLTAISTAIASAMDYVPNVVAAVMIVIVGAAIAQFSGRAVRSMAKDAGIQFASAMGSVTYGFIFFVLAMMAIAQLRVETRMVELAAGTILAAGGLGFGLALGLGSRDAMRSILAGYYARQLLRIGSVLEVDGTRGTLVSITPTQLLLETETDFVTVPNTTLMEKGGRQPK